MKKIVAAIFMCAVMVLVAAVPLAMADTHYVTKGAQGPRASALTWEYVPPSLGIWTGHIVNNGLRSLVVDVYDNTSGMPEEIMHQRIRFAVYDAYPIGTVDTAGVIMAAHRLYSITVTPNGPKGSTCTVDDVFDAAEPPVAIITIVSVDYLSIAVSGSLSYDPDGTIVAYEWDFGDGSSTTGVTASHTYAQDGTYTITLLVTDNEGLNGSATQDVTVLHQLIPPVASFTAAMDWMTVSVDASASSDNYGPIASYAWDFGDGMTATGVTASHTYAAEGLYTITLTVTDSDGQTGTASTIVEAKMMPVPVPPVAMITATIDYLNVAVDSVGSYDPDGTIVTYAWAFGDGSSASGPTATHSYATDGTRTITLTVTDNDGLIGTATQDVTVMHQLIPPVASFTAVTSWMDVSVDGSASTDNYGPIVSYAWDFGDGMTGTGMTATHTYALEGLYTITLTVTDSDGQTGTASKDVEAIMMPVLLPPVAMMSTTQMYLDVSVDSAGSYDPDGTIVTYAWAFGDGMSASGPTATHSYAMAGTYTIVLTVTDNDGLTGTASADVTVVAAIPPVAMFSLTQKYLDVAVDGSGSYDLDGTIASFAWTFGDGSSAAGMTATHTYAAAGTYTIILTVTDNDGLTGSASTSVTVLAAQNPVAMFTWTQTYLDVTVDGSGSYDLDGTIVSYVWSFGDGASATGPTAAHSYAADGTYTITLTVTDNDGLTGSDSKSITVGAAIPPVAAFSWTAHYLNVAVDGSGSYDPDGTIASFAWTFGDGGSAAGMTASHTYAAAGTYTITLTVTDNDGLIGSASEAVTVVAAVPPVARLTATATYLSVAVDGSTSSDADGTIASYAWTFGDGAVATGMTATHTYAAAGTYTITLTVTDNDGLTGSASQQVTVVAAQNPVAMFSWTQLYLKVDVDGSGSYDLDGTIVSYVWNFGDGAVATGMTASHTYAAAGTYTITLTVTDNDGLTGAASGPVTVVAAIPPVAAISWTAAYLVVDVDGSGSHDLDGTIASYAWTFGDGSSATGMTATHTYAAAGTYTIALTVTDNDGLTGSASVSVTVVAAQQPVAVFTWTQKYLDIAVDGSGSYDLDGTIASYAWTFGDGSSATGLTATHSYAAAGTYTITLTVTDNDGLTGAASGPVTVVAAIPPVAAFSWTAHYLDVAVDGSTSSDADGTIASYAWTFGDGAVATGMTASHAYAAAGTYTITLTVTDNDGLTGSTSQQVTVSLPAPPVASFTYTVSGMTVDVNAAGSTGTGLSYSWAWGDGTTGSGVTASHTYAAALMAVTGKSRAPGPPHPVFGMTMDEFGNPMNGATVTITETRTGEVIVWDQNHDGFDPASNIYSVDLSEFPNGYTIGDILHIEATLGTYSGFTDAPITSTPEGYDWIDVIMYPGAEPIIKTITLTVTDMFGRTATYSQDVTLSP